MRTSPVGITFFRGASAALLVVLLLSTGCGDDDNEAGAGPVTTESQVPSPSSDDGSRSTPTTEAPTTTATTEATTSTVDPEVVPPAAEITPEYVQAVLDQLYVLYQQAFVAAKAEGGLGERYRAAMSAVFTTTAVSSQTDGFQEFGGVAVIAPAPGRPTATVEKLLSAKPTCISLTAQVDLMPLVTKPVNPVQPYYLRLVPENETPANPTPWLIAYSGYTRDATVPEEATCPD
jgi:hypothetical protein